MKKYWKVQTMRSEENNKLNRIEVDVVTKFIKDEVESSFSDHKDYDYMIISLKILSGVFLCAHYKISLDLMKLGEISPLAHPPPSCSNGKKFTSMLCSG